MVMKMNLYDIEVLDSHNQKIKLSKYNNIYEDIENSTIPFFMIPNIIIISSKEQKYNKSNEYENIYFLDSSLNKLFNYL